MTRAAFGQREARQLTYAHAGVLKEHADYTSSAKERKPVRKKLLTPVVKKKRVTVNNNKQRMSLLDRILTSLTVVALAFAAVNIFLPDAAVAAALRVSEIAGIALPA
jgi:hypothetical protein